MALSEQFIFSKGDVLTLCTQFEATDVKDTEDLPLSENSGKQL